MDINIHQRFEHNMTQLHKAVLDQDIETIKIILALNDKLILTEDSRGFNLDNLRTCFKLFNKICAVYFFNKCKNIIAILSLSL